jgi:hypothetical protein
MCTLSSVAKWHRRGRTVRFALCLVCVAGISFIVGCDDSKATVSGTVTLDGRPVTGGPRMNGIVTFFRDGGGGAPAVGFIDESGHYSVKTGATTGMEPGSYQVAIAMKKITIPENPNAMPIPTLLTPAKYGNPQKSGLRAEIKPGNNTFDFPLVSVGGN